MRRSIIRIGLALIVACTGKLATAEGWRLSGGLTTNEGRAFEVTYEWPRWELTVGYAGTQVVDVRRTVETCRWITATELDCDVTRARVEGDVDDYLYLSAQRLFEFRHGRRFRPVIGLGLVGQSDTNAYVSSQVNFSLSLGLNLGERAVLQWRHFSNGGVQEPNLGQDILLVSWRL